MSSCKGQSSSCCLCFLAVSGNPGCYRPLTGLQSTQPVGCNAKLKSCFGLYPLLYPFREMRADLPGYKVTLSSRKSSATQSCKCMLGFFSPCFRNPPKSDIDYRIFNIRDHSHYACVYTRGFGTPTASQHNMFDSEKFSKGFFRAPDGVQTSGSLDLESDALPGCRYHFCEPDVN